MGAPKVTKVLPPGFEPRSNTEQKSKAVCSEAPQRGYPSHENHGDVAGLRRGTFLGAEPWLAITTEGSLVQTISKYCRVGGNNTHTHERHTGAWRFKAIVNGVDGL